MFKGHLHRRRSARKRKIVLFASKLFCLLQIRVPEKIINVKTVISICTFNKNPLQSRFDNLSNPSSNNLANSQANVLLQTAFVKVGDLQLQKQPKVNVLFDTGGQRTYISNDLKNYLNLPVLRKERI